MADLSSRIRFSLLVEEAITARLSDIILDQDSHLTTDPNGTRVTGLFSRSTLDAIERVMASNDIAGGLRPLRTSTITELINNVQLDGMGPNAYYRDQNILNARVEAIMRDPSFNSSLSKHIRMTMSLLLWCSYYQPIKRYLGNLDHINEAVLALRYHIVEGETGTTTFEDWLMDNSPQGRLLKQYNFQQVLDNIDTQQDRLVEESPFNRQEVWESVVDIIDRRVMSYDLLVMHTGEITISEYSQDEYEDVMEDRLFYYDICRAISSVQGFSVKAKTFDANLTLINNDPEFKRVAERMDKIVLIRTLMKLVAPPQYETEEGNQQYSFNELSRLLAHYVQNKVNTRSYDELSEYELIGARLRDGWFQEFNQQMRQVPNINGIVMLKAAKSLLDHEFETDHISYGSLEGQQALTYYESLLPILEEEIENEPQDQRELEAFRTQINNRISEAYDRAIGIENTEIIQRQFYHRIIGLIEARVVNKNPNLKRLIQYYFINRIYLRDDDPLRARIIEILEATADPAVTAIDDLNISLAEGTLIYRIDTVSIQSIMLEYLKQHTPRIGHSAQYRRGV